MRHNRSKSFNAALTAPPVAEAGAHRWTDDAADPNDPRALVARADVLRRAWRPPIADRVRFIADRCAGKRVLDIGCVAHDVARMSSPQWLHGQVAAVAASCVGVYVLDSGIQQMRENGFDAVSHDLREGLGPLADRGPFDVIVAGELIEHVETIAMLFTTAAAGLAPEGEMILSTPNPYAPARVRAGQRGIVWENVDHILYAFPSGIAELCERYGLVLAEATTSVDRGPSGIEQRLRAVKRRLRGTRYETVGYTTVGSRRVVRAKASRFGGLGRLWRRGAPFLGETFLYVVRRE